MAGGKSHQKAERQMKPEEADLLKWANDQPIVLSLLYDLDLMPEQIDDSDVGKRAHMLNIIGHFKSFAGKPTDK